MNKLVRKRTDHLYLSTDGGWIRTVAEARVFGSVLEAIDCINALGLTECEIVFKATQENLDLVLPVAPMKPLVAFSQQAQHALERL
jgi:hypothetical protein